jgi:putative endonuclease
MPHTVYILLCADGTYYTGQTKYLQQRLDEHNRGKSHYTQSRLPVKLIHKEEFASEAEAIRREKQIKNWSHDKKQNLAEGKYHEIRILAKKKFR